MKMNLLSPKFILRGIVYCLGIFGLLACATNCVPRNATLSIDFVATRSGNIRAKFPKPNEEIYIYITIKDMSAEGTYTVLASTDSPYLECLTCQLTRNISLFSDPHEYGLLILRLSPDTPITVTSIPITVMAYYGGAVDNLIINGLQTVVIPIDHSQTPAFTVRYTDLNRTVKANDLILLQPNRTHTFEFRNTGIPDLNIKNGTIRDHSASAIALLSNITLTTHQTQQFTVSCPAEPPSQSTKAVSFLYSSGRVTDELFRFTFRCSSQANDSSIMVQQAGRFILPGSLDTRLAQGVHQFEAHLATGDLAILAGLQVNQAQGIRIERDFDMTEITSANAISRFSLACEADTNPNVPSSIAFTYNKQPYEFWVYCDAPVVNNSPQGSNNPLAPLGEVPDNAPQDGEEGILRQPTPTPNPDQPAGGGFITSVLSCTIDGSDIYYEVLTTLPDGIGISSSANGFSGITTLSGGVVFGQASPISIAGNYPISITADGFGSASIMAACS